MINILSYLENTITKMDDTSKLAFIGDNSSLTFSELYAKSRSCGSFIASKKLNKQPIIVFMKKAPDMIAAFLGVVYSGNYYVPLDSEIPTLRIRMILEEVKSPLIICDGVTSKLLDKWRSERDLDWNYDYSTILFSDICDYEANDLVLSTIRKNAIDVDPLYVVFTSGSTGTPKGVIVKHRSVIDYIENLSSVIGVSSDTIFGNQSPLYLDACLKEVFPTLKYGATTYLIPTSLFMFPVKLIEYINDNKINTICWVASALSMVAGLGAFGIATPTSLHTIAFGSEIFPTKHLNIWKNALPNARFIHLYGPTEATGMSCYYEITSSYDYTGSIPIGKPFPNTEIILLDDKDCIPSDGELGEICIRGAGLSLGYFNDKEKTNSVFVQNPLSIFPDIIYRTGDMGYYGYIDFNSNYSGNEKRVLFYKGRRDYQIKHMGYRIELTEIELMAASIDGVGLACAVFDSENSRIILYYMGEGADVATVKAFLKANLPRYMLPYAIISCDDIPKTAGGKIDRVKLLERRTRE
ncbi:MAG: amino acid adenylation domain-containing protein [Oscillospiraceae bacterium]|jgi:amino acid adenylation domain-containing protein|nr:amino acid adenylation domain-containing protein [Oscillospiraceae bacterium]